MDRPANVDIVRSAFETFNREGVESVIDHFAPDFAVTVPPTMSAEPDTYRGRDGIRRWFGGFDGYMEDVRMDLEQLEEAGPDTVVAQMRLRARGTESGIAVDQPVAQVLRLRDARVRRIEVYPTMEEARAAAGLGAGAPITGSART